MVLIRLMSGGELSTGKKEKDTETIWKAGGRFEVGRRHGELKRVIINWNSGGEIERRL